MIIVGVLLIVLAAVLPDFATGLHPGLLHLVAIGGVIGWILVVVGIVLFILGLLGHPVGGRRWYY
jgi:Family of unknown function (DUF6131)